MADVTTIEQIPGLLDFPLPAELEAGEPPEARGLSRDEVRLMVSCRSTGLVQHGLFCDLPAFLQPGDVLVINTSKTLPAALIVTRAGEKPCELHLSSRLPTGEWTVELREMSDKGTRPLLDARAGEQLRLPAGATVTLVGPYPRGRAPELPSRLWVARIDVNGDLYAYLNRHGFPIRYHYVHERWPLACYQTVYATEAGSAEMPSAGRAFTAELITQLVARGVQITPLVLHTGVASLESNEPPYEEYFCVNDATAQLVNTARSAGRRVIAIGTTVIRALETAADDKGIVRARDGWTSLVITPQRGVRVVDGLLTGLHEPRATHLAMLEALAGHSHLTMAYSEALRCRYLWHEFGDLHLILP